MPDATGDRHTHAQLIQIAQSVYIFRWHRHPLYGFSTQPKNQSVLHVVAWHFFGLLEFVSLLFSMLVRHFRFDFDEGNFSIVH